MRQPEYRLYVDETGDVSRNADESIGRRYLGLVGIILKLDDAFTLAQRLDALKSKHFGHHPDEPVILHRTEIVQASGAFYRLRNEDDRAVFDAALVGLMRLTPFKMAAVVIDKRVDGDARPVVNPYHVGLRLLLDRYTTFLLSLNAVGDVIAESRGKSEDRHLSQAFEAFFRFGSTFTEPQHAARVLSSSQIKIKPKSSNIAGLQLADLLAHPMMRDVLTHHEKLEHQGGSFAKMICEVCEEKCLPEGRMLTSIEA